MRVRLTKKYAECIDDIDLSGRDVGDILNLSDADAGLLVAEGWASALGAGRRRTFGAAAKAADYQPRRTKRPRRPPATR